MKSYDSYQRWMYRRGHPNHRARVQNRACAIAFAAGILPRRAAALDIRGRRSGRVISVPVVVAGVEGERYLVAMLGQNANWVPTGSARPCASRKSTPASALRSCAATCRSRQVPGLISR